MLNATITERINITDALMIIRVKPDDGVNNFLPGQYLAVGLFPDAPRIAGTNDPEEVKPEKIIRRSYSIGSTPDEKGYYEFYIAIVPDGALTARLALIKAGDRVHVAPKVVGKFTLEEVSADKNLIFVATGTGLAPFVSMIKTASTWTPGRKITMLHGVRFPEDLAYREELKEMQISNPNFKYYATVSRAPAAWEGDQGYVQDYFKKNIVQLDPAKDSVFLCGNPAMVDEVETLLISQGYIVHSKKTPGNLHVEKYW